MASPARRSKLPAPRTASSLKRRNALGRCGATPRPPGESFGGVLRYRPAFTRLVVGHYIIDLACSEAKLAGQLDGS